MSADPNKTPVSRTGMRFLPQDIEAFEDGVCHAFDRRMICAEAVVLFQRLQMEQARRGRWLDFRDITKLIRFWQDRKVLRLLQSLIDADLIIQAGVFFYSPDVEAEAEIWDEKSRYGKARRAVRTARQRQNSTVIDVEFPDHMTSVRQTFCAENVNDINETSQHEIVSVNVRETLSDESVSLRSTPAEKDQEMSYSSSDYSSSEDVFATDLFGEPVRQKPKARRGAAPKDPVPEDEKSVKVKCFEHGATLLATGIKPMSRSRAGGLVRQWLQRMVTREDELLRMIDFGINVAKPGEPVSFIVSQINRFESGSAGERSFHAHQSTLAHDDPRRFTL